MGAPPDEDPDHVDVEELDASMLEADESGVMPMPLPPSKAPAPPAPIRKASMSEEDAGWFEDLAKTTVPVGGVDALAVDQQPAVSNNTEPGIIPVGRMPAPASHAAAPIPAIGLPHTPAGSVAKPLAVSLPRTVTPVVPRVIAPRPATAPIEATQLGRPAVDASDALPIAATATPSSTQPGATTPVVRPPAAVPRTITPVAEVAKRATTAPVVAQPVAKHDATMALADDDVAIVVEQPIGLPHSPAGSVAVPRTRTGNKQPAPPAPTPDERLIREATALAAEFPMRAALVHAYRAFARSDEAAYKQAAQLAPEARFVAYTRRWLASTSSSTRDPKQIEAAVHAELPLAGDASERAALLWQIAAVTGGANASTDATVEATLRQIVELDGNDLGAWVALGLLAMRRKRYAVAAEAFEATGAKTEDAVARAVFLSSAGGLREGHCSDDAGARAAFDRAFEADPENAGAVAALEMHALRTGAKADAVRMAALEARRIGDLDPALGYHERAGDLYWEGLRDGVNAAQCYEHAAKLASTDVVALGKLASLYEQEGRHVPLATVYEQLLERIAEPVRRGAVLLRLGGLYESRLDRPTDALRCYQAALASVPTLAPAAQALARLHQTRQRWGEAAMVLMVEVDRLVDGSQRAARYLAIAEMLEANLGTIPQVVKLYERALQLDAGQTAALDALDRHYRSNGRWTDLIGMYENQLSLATHPMRVRADRIALAALYHDRAAAPEKAAKQLELAMAGAPDHLFTQVALGRALADSGKWAEYANVLEQQAKLISEGPEHVATLYRIASVVEVRLGDPVRAVDAYKRVLAKSPKHELATQALLRLYIGQSRWDDAIASERKLLALVERPEEAAVILHRIAHVAEEHLAKPDDAIAAYEAALKHLPSYRPARVSLERLLRAQGNYAKLAALLEEQAAAVGDEAPRDRARLLCGSALVREMHVPGAEAAKLYGEALVAEPHMVGALWGQLRLQIQASNWKSASETLAVLCAQAKQGKPRARLIVQLVRILEMRLGDLENAAVLAEQAFASDADPAIILERMRIALGRSEPDALHWLEEAARITSDPKLASALLRVRANAIEALGDRDDAAEAFAIALQHGSLPAVVEGLARNRTGPALGEALSIRAAQLKDAPTRALLYTVAGLLHEQPDASANAYSAALAAQPGLFPALEGHRRLAERVKDWRGAATICAEMAAVAVDKLNRVELFEEAAALCSDRLSDDVGAIAHYREVLADQPGRTIALDRVLALFEKNGEWSAAAQLIGEQIASVSDDKRAEMLARRARILAERLGDTSAAIADLDRALVLRPNDPELLSLVASLHESLQQWADAARAYELLAKAGDVETRGRALVAQARIWTVEVPDYARAQRYLEEATKLDPHDRGIAARLAEVTSLAGDTKRAVELYQNLATHGLPMDRVEALLAFADLQKRMGETNSIDALAPAFDLAFDDHEVVRLLEGYYRLNDKLDRYIVHAEASVNRARPGGRWADTGPLRVSVGKIYARETTAPPNASPFLEAAVEAAPDDVRLRVTLASTYARVNDAAAIRELRIAIEKEPTDSLAFQRLVEACARTGRELAASVLATAVALLDGEDNRPGIVLPAPQPGSLNGDDALALFVGQTRAPDIRRVVTHLDPHLSALFAEKDKLDGAVQLPETYPVVGVIRSIAAALGVDAVALFWRERSDLGLAAVDPPALILTPRQVKDDPTKIRFDVGYVLARVAAQSTIGQIAPLDQVGATLAAITDGIDKRVMSALPRRARKELEKMLPELDHLDAPSLRLWDAEERRRALACGVVASCDLRAVAASLCPDALVGRVEDRRVRLRASPMMAEALRLATSDQCWNAIARFYGRP